MLSLKGLFQGLLLQHSYYSWGLYASNALYKRSKAPRFRLDHHVMVVVAVMEVAVTAEEDISDFGVRYFRYLIRQLVNDNTKA